MKLRVLAFVLTSSTLGMAQVGGTASIRLIENEESWVKYGVPKVEIGGQLTCSETCPNGPDFRGSGDVAHVADDDRTSITALFSPVRRTGTYPVTQVQVHAGSNIRTHLRDTACSCNTSATPPSAADYRDFFSETLSIPPVIANALPSQTNYFKVNETAYININTGMVPGESLLVTIEGAGVSYQETFQAPQPSDQHLQHQTWVAKVTPTQAGDLKITATMTPGGSASATLPVPSLPTGSSSGNTGGSSRSNSQGAEEDEGCSTSTNPHGSYAVLAILALLLRRTARPKHSQR